MPFLTAQFRSDPNLIEPLTRRFSSYDQSNLTLKPFAPGPRRAGAKGCVLFSLSNGFIYSAQTFKPNSVQVVFSRHSSNELDAQGPRRAPCRWGRKKAEKDKGFPNNSMRKPIPQPTNKYSSTYHALMLNNCCCTILSWVISTGKY